MFFYQRKIKHSQVRTIKLRDEWGELKFEVVQAELEPDGKELAEQCQTTVIWRRHAHTP